MMRSTRTVLFRASPIALCKTSIINEAASPTKIHDRSQFSYSGSEKAGDVGARNEAAFIGYKAFQPTDIQQKYAMPHLVNLLTVLPLWMAAFIGNAVFWGVVAWDLYVNRHYTTVVIERPKALE